MIRSDVRKAGTVGTAGRFLRDQTGLGAIEFACVAPFFIILYIGGVDLARAITLDRKVQHVASTINDLITQSQSVTADDIRNIFTISGSLIAPYDDDLIKINVTSVYVDEAGMATVDWSCATAGMSTLPKGVAYALPAQFRARPKTYVVTTETRYDYRPLSGFVFVGTVTMGGTSYLAPRVSASVQSEGCPP